MKSAKGIETVSVEAVSFALASLISISPAVEQFEKSGILGNAESCAEAAITSTNKPVEFDSDRPFDAVADTITKSLVVLRLGLEEVKLFCPTIARDEHSQSVGFIPGVNASLTRAIRYARVRQDQARNIITNKGAVRGREKITLLETLQAHGANRIFTALEIVTKRTPGLALKAAVGIITPEKIVGTDDERMKRDKRFREEIYNQFGEEGPAEIISNAVDVADVTNIADEYERIITNMLLSRTT